MQGTTSRNACGRWSAVILLLVLVLRPVGGAGAEQLAHGPDVMVIGGLQVPPYIIVDEEGQASGLVVDLLRRALEQVGVRPHFEITNWARAFAGAKAGRLDALIPALRSPDREEVLVYPSEPLTVLNMVVIRHAGDRELHYDGDLNVFRDMSMGRIRSARVAPAFDEAAAAGMFRLEERASFGLLALGVAHRRIDLMAGDELMGLWGAAENGVLEKLKVMDPPLAQAPVYLAISKGSPFAARAEEIAESLAKARRSQEFKEALMPYGELLQQDLFEKLLKLSSEH